MARILGAVLLASLAALTVWGVLTLYDENMKLGRMWETPAVRPHEQPLPVMDPRSIPLDGGEARLRIADPAVLKAPFDLNRPDVIAAGRQGYGRFCVHCHGEYFDGNGRVGQSFAPLPGDLRSAKVQSLPMGNLFHEISYGIPGGRQPALASTIAIDQRWQIVAFVQSLGRRQ